MVVEGGDADAERTLSSGCCIEGERASQSDADSVACGVVDAFLMGDRDAVMEWVFGERAVESGCGRARMIVSREDVFEFIVAEDGKDGEEVEQSAGVVVERTEIRAEAGRAVCARCVIHLHSRLPRSWPSLYSCGRALATTQVGVENKSLTRRCSQTLK